MIAPISIKNRADQGNVKMANPLDHFMWAASDLDTGVTAFERLSGVRAGVGGVHPGRGTRNALASLGAAVYLEIIAPDPGQKLEGTPGGELRSIASPRINALVARSRDLETVQKAYAAGGIVSDILDGGRTTPAGAFIRWRILIPRRNELGPFAPLFIDWLDSVHPGKTSTPGCTLTRFEAGHPDTANLAGLWRSLGLDISLSKADRPCFLADLSTPHGPLRLTGMGN
jgi:hypothetical protein